MATTSNVTPKDFFLWLGIVVSLYGSLIAFITLLFDYINRTFPDALAGYADPYATGVRVAMAALIVLVPLTLVLLVVVRKTIAAEAGKADIWVRRWALVLTLFIAGAVVAGDLITLITTFLGGEITTRFLLKVAVVLLVAGAVFMHFLAELKGYWVKNTDKARFVGIAAALLTVVAIAAGFFIVGTPSSMRDARFDEQKLMDLQSLQYRIADYFREKQTVPESLEVFNDPISSYMVPVDPETKQAYSYEKVSDTSFKLCADFNQESKDLSGKGGYMGRDMAYPSSVMEGGIEENWKHEAGQTCFERTIDPAKYQPYPKPAF